MLQTEAIVLKSVEYKESKRILTLFTENYGLLSLICYGVSRKNPRLFELTSPMAHVEVFFEKTKGELYRLKEGKSLDSFLPIRSSFASMEAAGKMLRAICDSQLPEKPAPALFHLLLKYLQRLSAIPQPSLLYYSFLLKLLFHEGLFSLEEEGIDSAWTPSEWEVVKRLCSASSFSMLLQVNLPQALEEKIQIFFQNR